MKRERTTSLDLILLPAMLSLLSVSPYGAQAQTAGCSADLIYDDGEFENGYAAHDSFAGDVTYLMRFDGGGRSAVDTVCVCFQQRQSTVQHLAFTIEIVDDNGPQGIPGSVLASLGPFSAEGVPPHPVSSFYQVAFPEVVTDGTVFIGPKWRPNQLGSKFWICGDESGPPRSPAYQRLGDGPWVDTSAAFPAYSALGVRTDLRCRIEITRQPENQTVALGTTATFSVEAPGGRELQWQRDGVDIPGATGPTYTIPPVTGADSGTSYRVRIDGGCATVLSRRATLTVVDHEPPRVRVLEPRGGEFWVLAEEGDLPNTELITWEMSDNVRICHVEVSLWYSDDGGGTFLAAPPGGGLPVTFGATGPCPNPGEGTTSTEYLLPHEPPSGTIGSLYQVQVQVTDHAGQTTTARSRNPFFLTRPNPETVKTLLLSNLSRMQSRMGITSDQAAALSRKLRELSDHPRVLGLVVDLGAVTDLSDPETGLYASWDQAPADPDRANQVLFGCHPLLPAGCATERDGVHDVLRELLEIYTGVDSVILVGDDRIIPLARIEDKTVLLPESSYPAGGDLTPAGTTVGQALAADLYLSDDPLAIREPVRWDELRGSLFIPDLSVGRLVETPEEIIQAIATFLSQDGLLDLSAVHPVEGHKILVTGYDFLLDSGRRIREHWKTALGVVTPDNSTAPVDGQLLTETWRESSVSARIEALRRHLAGHGGERYGIASLSGHATHYEEGVPGMDRFDIQGLATVDLYGGDACGTPSSGSLDLAGSVVYALGCHGGLPVAGSCLDDSDHSLDLPQTMLSRGVLAYVANTGYGWGLLHGIGYGERLMQIFTEEMSRGGTIEVGEAVRRTKLRYFMETARFDSYDAKSLMQWTLFGFPMYAVRSGIASRQTAAGGGAAMFQGLPPGTEELSAVAGQGKVSLRRQLLTQEAQAPASGDAAALPPYLTQLNLHFDLTAPGVYTKRGATGEELPLTPGCPVPEGCYYTLNGVVERGSGMADLPIQPVLIFDSRLAGTSQHGVLWKGGVYEEEGGWIPVFGELASNGGDTSARGSTPRIVSIKPSNRRPTGAADDDQCRPGDLEINGLVVPTGEVLRDQEADLTYDLQRIYREIDLEVFYFNNTGDSTGNCDRTGPELGAGHHDGDYHRVEGSKITWAVPAQDEGGVWRVLVVVNEGGLDPHARGAWVPVELSDDGTGVWRGTLSLHRSSSRLTYVLQAVDNRGNVTWLDYVTSELPASGVPLGIPRPVDVVTGPSGNPSPSSGPGRIHFAAEGFLGAEADGELTVTVLRSGAVRGPSSVRYLTADLTATASTDYRATSGTLRWLDGDSEPKTFVVPLIDDALEESTELIRLRLVEPRGADLDPKTEAVGAIQDGDGQPSGCDAGDDALCLLQGRFQVEVAGWNQRGREPKLGHVSPHSDNTGLFWFFEAANIDLTVKILDGRATNGAFWLFHSPLSDLEYWVIATDTWTGHSRLYHKGPYSLCGGADVQAFPDPQRP